LSISNSEPVVISDDVVYLRRVLKSDLDFYYRWYIDPEIQKFMANPYWDPAKTKDDYRQVFLHRHFLQTGTGNTLTICTCGDGKPVGLINYFEIDRKLKRCEIGLLVGERELWGRGIGTSSVRLACSHIFESLGLSKIFCLVHPENEASVRLFQKCGFTFEKEVKEWDTILHRYVLRRDSGVQGEFGIR